MSCLECEKLKKQIKALQKGGQHRARRNKKYRDLVRERNNEFKNKIDILNKRNDELAKRIYEIRKGLMT
jgi:predicted nuclease with TOPRIM domain